MKDTEIITLIEESVIALKYIPLECHIGHTKNKNLIKVVLFHEDRDVSSDDCTAVAEIISRRLDIDEPFEDKAYDLVVESPGLEREIKSPSEYQYFVGKEFRVFPISEIITKEGFFIATLQQVADGILVFKNETAHYELNFDQIIKARLHCDFSKILKENKKK